MVYVTAASEEEGHRIGRALVERRLAACVNVIPRIRSVYWWKGRLEESDEALVLVKTLRDQLDGIERAVQELHGYEVPAISAIPVERLYEPYLRWMHEELPGASGGRAWPEGERDGP